MFESAQRIKQLPRYLFAEVDRKIREKVSQGVDVIRLGIGDPDSPTPEFIIQRLREEAGRRENHRYPPDEGLMEFKQAVAAYYAERHRVNLDPQREVLPLIGSKEGIAHISFSFINPGEISLVPDPGYPVYSIGAQLAGGEPYPMPLTEGNGYLPNFDQIPPGIAAKAKLMFLNYPNNPTGAVASREFFQRAVEFARLHNILVCHDAAYSELVYDGLRPLSILEVPESGQVAIEFNSLSKTFNMTGWRIGYAVGNAEALEVLGRFKSNIDSGLFQAVQYCGVEALTNPARDIFIDSLREKYWQRREIVATALERLGWPPPVSRGAFYIWAPVPAGYSSEDFVTRLLEDTGVVVTPGRGFGQHGEGYFRVALTVEAGRLQEAMGRISNSICFK